MMRAYGVAEMPAASSCNPGESRAPRTLGPDDRGCPPAGTWVVAPKPAGWTNYHTAAAVVGVAGFAYLVFGPHQWRNVYTIPTSDGGNLEIYLGPQP